MLVTLPFHAVSLFRGNEWIFGDVLCKISNSFMDIGKISAPLFMAAIALHQTYCQLKVQEIRDAKEFKNKFRKRKLKHELSDENNNIDNENIDNIVDEIEKQIDHQSCSSLETSC